MRKPYIAGNWKMNMTPSEGAALAGALAKATKGVDTKVMIAPPYVDIPAVLKAVEGSSIIVAAQNMSDHEKGAFTGEVAPAMLKDLGVKDVILGHSERRTYYGETDELINSKLKLALKYSMDVVLCIGETLQQRQAGKLEEVLSRQVTVGLKDLKAEDMVHVTIAYEPIWAIGTGVTATGEDANNAHAFIRSLVQKLFGESVAKETIIQYGGSVKPNNVKELLSFEHIDGALVGGASLSVENFLPIVKCGNVE